MQNRSSHQARGRKQPVKAFLLNQERIAGVGNIYADEALFITRIHPLRPIGTLRPLEQMLQHSRGKRLVPVIRTVP